MWACGVILLSLLSGRPNFFNAPDDMTSLCQLVALFGKGALCEAAERMGKRLLVEIDGSKPSTLKVCLLVPVVSCSFTSVSLLQLLLSLQWMPAIPGAVMKN